MTVYVDALVDYGLTRKWRYGASCHMWADTLEELHDHAARIGMKRAWFQDHPSLPHYDLTTKRRAVAVKMGAVPASLKEHLKLRRAEPPKGERG